MEIFVQVETGVDGGENGQSSCQTWKHFKQS